MIRKIISIDEGLCNGCGACASACHEGAIGMVNGKARLLRDDYCDGLGDCLPACPTGAITFVEREAKAYDQAAVEQAKAGRQGGCPGTRAVSFQRQGQAQEAESQLRQWPVQLQLVPVQAPWLEGADVLLAADCTAYAYGSFHRDFLAGKAALVGCPKLDPVNYAEKLTEILKRNEVKSVSLVRMEVPCCGGLEVALSRALKASGRQVPCQVTVIATDGRILEQRPLAL